MTLSDKEVAALLATFDDYGALDSAARKGTLTVINDLLIRLQKHIAALARA